MDIKLKDMARVLTKRYINNWDRIILFKLMTASVLLWSLRRLNYIVKYEFKNERSRFYLYNNTDKNESFTSSWWPKEENVV